MRFLASSARGASHHPLFLFVKLCSASASACGGQRWITDASRNYILTRRKSKRAIPFVIQRGGTSKGIFFHKEDLPECPHLRDLVIKDAFGSPDVRQIDGLGGADILTSKVAIVGKREGALDSGNKDLGTHDIVADIDYLFGQVEFGKTRESNSKNGAPTGVSYDVNCGNISAGIGPFAIEEGLIEVTDDTVTPMRGHADIADDSEEARNCQKVRIHNVNTGKVIVAEVPVEKVFTEDSEGDERTQGYWEVVEDGNYEIDGVPGTSAYLPLDFSKCIGTLGAGKVRDDDGVVTPSQEVLPMLPSGNPRDSVVVDNHEYDVSLLDVANFVVHIDGRQLGLTGKESSAKILNDEELWNKVRKIRYEAAKLVMREEDITLTKPFTSVVFPFVPDLGYKSVRGDVIREKDEEGNIAGSSIDFRAFVLFCDHPHKAYPGTASNATAAAALIDGTVVSDMVIEPIETSEGKGNDRYKEKVVTIGHPSGRMSVSSKVEDRRTSIGDGAVATNEFTLLRSVIGRTSRRLADGRLYLKAQTVRQLDAAERS